MHEVRKSALAESDLIDIWLYSARRWGETQADGHFTELGTALDRLSENPDIGKPCEYIREGYRALPVGQHVVCYRVSESIVHVTLVLHGRMDPDRHL